jgi:hypothetical protein
MYSNCIIMHTHLTLSQVLHIYYHIILQQASHSLADLTTSYHRHNALLSRKSLFLSNVSQYQEPRDLPWIGTSSNGAKGVSLHKNKEVPEIYFI